MSSAAIDEVSRLFAEPKGPSMHPEDIQFQARSRSITPDSDSHHADAVINNGSHNQARYGITSQPSYSLSDANTGPKGVIADARAFERAWLARRKSPSTSNAAAGGSGGMWPFSRGGGDNSKRPGSGRSSRHSTPERDSPQQQRNAAVLHQHDDGAINNMMMAEDNDEEFIQRWRNERLSELRGAGNKPRSRRQSPSMRRYGRLETVDAVGYLDAIEKVAKETVVVVCIYDDESELSSQVESHLSVLATKHTTTRFVRLHYLEAEMDAASIPAILAYKQGELMANLVAVVNEIPIDKGLTVGSLEGVMRMHNILT